MKRYKPVKKSDTRVIFEKTRNAHLTNITTGFGGKEIWFSFSNGFSFWVSVQDGQDYMRLFLGNPGDPFDETAKLESAR